MNIAIIKGRIGNDIELKKTNSGKSVVKLRVAVDRRGKDAGPDWLDVIAWEKTAEFAAQYLGKGRAILVNGRIQSRQYDAQDGTKRNVVEIVADTIEFADSKPQATAQAPAQAAPAPARQAAPAQAPAPAAQSWTPSDDDIPF